MSRKPDFLLQQYAQPQSYTPLFVWRRCVLVTFYFTQQLLPSLAVVGVEGATRSARIDEAIEFVKMFGAYLRLHLCLVSAAMVKADAVIDELLALSKFDPRHREVTKELAKSTNLVLYDPVRFLIVLHVLTCTFLLTFQYWAANRLCYRRYWRALMESAQNRSPIDAMT